MEIDPGGKWLVMWRGALAVSVNFAPESVTVPVSAGTVLLASDEPVAVDEDGLRLPGQSMVISRPSDH